MKSRSIIAIIAAAAIVPLGAEPAKVATKPAEVRPEWEMGPFVKHPTPVLLPTPASKFQCPILGKEVRWEEQNVYNPAAVVRDSKVWLLYRADDKNPGLKWGRTCRIGLASSEDGINFTRHPTPVLYPDKDIVLMSQTQGYGSAWALGQALIDRNDLTTVLKNPNKPFLSPELEWENKGFCPNTTVCNTLVPFQGQWLLYYGAADRYIGLAVFTPVAGSPYLLVK